MSNPKLYKSKNNSILFGVLGGLSNYFNIDPVLTRVVFVIAMVMFDTISGGLILGYILLAFVMPEEPIDYTDHPVQHRHRSKSQQPPDHDTLDEDEWSNF